MENSAYKMNANFDSNSNFAYNLCLITKTAYQCRLEAQERADKEKQARENQKKNFWRQTYGQSYSFAAISSIFVLSLTMPGAASKALRKFNDFFEKE